MSERLRAIAWDAWCEASMDENNSARECIDIVADAVMAHINKSEIAEDVWETLIAALNTEGKANG